MDDGELRAFVEQFRRLVDLAHERLPLRAAMAELAATRAALASGYKTR
jgi:hypothetical protein